MEITDVTIVVKIKKWESFVFNDHEYTSLCGQRYGICRISNNNYEINSPISPIGTIKNLENIYQRNIQKIILKAVENWSNSNNGHLPLAFTSYWRKDHIGGTDCFNQ